ncbi:MAG: hypothetical protein Q8L48_13855 [Archangium sp.]|nr:hypothetical protein [Archangium sp.]
MTSLVLSVVVMTSSGGLLSERTPAAGMLVGAVDLNAAGASYANMTVDQLTVERMRLVETMPSLGLGIALTAVGGGVLLTGLVILGSAYELIVVGLIVMAAAVPLLIIGPILLFGALRERREVQTQVRLVDQRIAQLKRDEFAPPPVQNDPGLNEVPPPPPVRPPGSEFAPHVPPQVLLATF